MTNAMTYGILIVKYSYDKLNIEEVFLMKKRIIIFSSAENLSLAEAIQSMFYYKDYIVTYIAINVKYFFKFCTIYTIFRIKKLLV